MPARAPLDAKARCRAAYDATREADLRSAVLYQRLFSDTLKQVVGRRARGLLRRGAIGQARSASVG